MRAAARRFLLLIGGIGAAVLCGGLLIAALGITSAERAVSLGFYAVGSFLALGGFLAGNRGPYRPGGSMREERFGGRSLRRATPDDERESTNMAVLLTTTGFLLLAVGVIIDSRVKLL